MEELRKLEQVQAVLELLRSHEVVSASSDPDADRFLSNFILLLVQPCGEIDIHGKCRLVKETIPKISGTFLEEVQALIGRDETMKLENSSCECGYQSNLVEDISNDHEFQSSVKEVDCRLLEEKNDKEAIIGLDAMQRANSTLEDFCRSYFMFHGMDVNNPQSVFKYLPVLFFVESYIYQLDTLNEKIVNLLGTGGETISQGLSKKESNSGGVFKSNPFKPLMELIDVHGLVTERIREEVKSGEEYWSLERKLCFALNHNQEISVADVMKAIHLKSFDYRVMNLLLYQLRGEMVDDLHMNFLSVSEFLVEVSDDLFDYEDDVLENTFNVLRMFVRIYGASAAPSMLVKCITEAEDKFDTLLKSLEPQLSLDYQRRCAEATAEGGSTGGHRFGTWSIPPVIVDEESYRLRMLTDY